MAITTKVRALITITACVLVTTACTVPTKMSSDDLRTIRTLHEADAQTDRAILHRSIRRSLNCADNYVPVCVATGRLGKQTCSCQDRFETLDWIEDTQMSEEF